MTRCIMQDRTCGEGTPCAMHDAWLRGQRAILEYLGAHTLAEFDSRTASKKLPNAAFEA